MHEPYQHVTTTAEAHNPVVYQPPLQQIVLAPTADDPRRALVQLEETGQWVLARVPAAPPVIVPAAPETNPRRPLSRLERTAIIVVGSACALTLSLGGALAMAGPYLAEAATLAFGTAAVLGAGTIGWVVLRVTRALSPSNGSQTAPAAEPTTQVVIHGQGGQGGRWWSKGGNGVHINHLHIKR